MIIDKPKSGERFKDLKEKIRILQDQNIELKNALRSSICPYCHKVRGNAHAYINGEEVACPEFAYFPDQLREAK